jgi:hypothetical protein
MKVLMFKINDRVVHDKCGIGKVLEVYITGIALVSFKNSTSIVSLKDLHKASKIGNKGEMYAKV